MGLDTVELVMEVEEAFGITIPDDEAEKIQTIGQLHRYVVARLGRPPLSAPGCLSASAFYRLRRQLMGLFRVDRRRIRPASALDDLIPRAGRREHWRHLGESLGWRLPELSRPDWVLAAWFALVFGWLVLDLVLWGRWEGFSRDAASVVFLSWFLGSILLGAAVYNLTRPFATLLPAADLRGLIPMVLAANFGTFRTSNPHGWNDREVWDAIVVIVAEQAGIAPDLLDESTSFVNDLGMG